MINLKKWLKILVQEGEEVDNTNYKPTRFRSVLYLLSDIAMPTKEYSFANTVYDCLIIIIEIVHIIGHEDHLQLIAIYLAIGDSLY